MGLFDTLGNIKKNLGKGYDMVSNGLDSLPDPLYYKVVGSGLKALLTKHGGMTHDQEWAMPMPKHMEDYFKKKGGKRKAKAKAKASQVVVNVKQVMSNDRTMIYPNSYLKQMETSQNTGRQNLFSGPPLQYASPPQVMYISHPNVNRPSLSDEFGTGTNPVPNRHRISVQDDNVNQPQITPVNPNDITQRVPDRRMVPSTRQMPSLSITQSIPSLPTNPMKGGPIPHMHSAGDDMKAEIVSVRALPSQPTQAAMSSQLIGRLEQLVNEKYVAPRIRLDLSTPESSQENSYRSTPSYLSTPGDSRAQTPQDLLYPYRQEAGHPMSVFERYKQ